MSDRGYTKYLILRTGEGKKEEKVAKRQIRWISSLRGRKSRGKDDPDRSLTVRGFPP